MFNWITTTLVFFNDRNPIVSKLVAFLLIYLCVINAITFVDSDFKSLTHGLLSSLFFLLANMLIYSIKNKSSILSLNMMQYLIDHQDEVASGEILNFFIQEAKKDGFERDFSEYLAILGRKPLIKECITKCMELSASKKVLDA